MLTYAYADVCSRMLTYASDGHSAETVKRELESAAARAATGEGQEEEEGHASISKGKPKKRRSGTMLATLEP